MRVRAAVIVVTAAWTAAGCGASPKDQVRAKVQEFATATADKDYGTICDDVLAPALVAHLTKYGIHCSDALRAALGAVRHPTLSIGPITVHGKRASVYALTLAQGQQASLDVLQLLDTPDGWRISALNAPLPP
jgi:hypothetical protein